MSIDLAPPVAMALVFAFSLSTIDKAILVMSRSAAWHPMFVGGRLRRRFSLHLVIAALFADGATVLLLMIRPGLGGIIAAVVIACYTVAYFAWGPARSSGSCRCFAFGFAAAGDRLSVAARNGVLLGLAILVALLGQAPVRVDAPGVVAAAAVLVLIHFGLAPLQRIQGRKVGSYGQ